MLKVLMFGWEFPPHNSGGLGTACLGLTRALCNQDVQITFVLPRVIEVVQSSNFQVKFAPDFVSLIDFKLIDSLIEPYLTSDQYALKVSENSLKGYGQSLLEEVRRFTVAAGKIARETSFDIIHAHDWMSIQAGIEAKKVSGKPLVVHIHSTEIDRTGGNLINDAIFQIEKAGMEEADQVIAVSDYTKQMIIKYYAIPESKISVVHNGIEMADYPQLEDGSNRINQFKELGYKIVLFVGRVTVQKGPDYFLQAAKKVLDYYPKVMFIMTGSGDMERKIIEMTASLGISDKVLFTGFLRDLELQKIYRMADLFVMPSVSEPFGITALESVANGAPVLVSKQSGVKEVLTQVLTADFWDIDEMTDKILGVLNYEALPKTLHKNSLEQLRGINWHKAAAKVMGVYHQVMDRVLGKKEI